MTLKLTIAIEIDVDVNSAIETRRTDFNQSHNAILREVFSLPKVQHQDPGPTATNLHGGRRTGKYAFKLHGKRFEERSLKAAYTSCLRQLAELSPRFLERLSVKSTKSRRIVAQDKYELFLKTPKLAEKHASWLKDNWWVDTNLSRLQCEKRLKIACDVAGLIFRVDLVLDFPN